MKIKVVRADGSIETINLVGSITAREPRNDLEFPRNQSPLCVHATGTDYFFREDGIYDGWGMSCIASEEEGLYLAEAVEKDREIEPPHHEAQS